MGPSSYVYYTFNKARDATSQSFVSQKFGTKFDLEQKSLAIIEATDENNYFESINQLKEDNLMDVDGDMATDVNKDDAAYVDAPEQPQKDSLDDDEVKSASNLGLQDSEEHYKQGGSKLVTLLISIM